VWHEEVRKFAVHDARPDRDDRLMGYFYIDMFPRPGKFTHAGCMVLQPSSLKSTGVRTLPSVALLVNFPRPTELRPSLLTHSEVMTFFHEFGHAMHTVCSETTTAMFAGTSVEKDFVEAPSQMLENWCWENETLQRLSSHYTTKESLSEDVITQLQSARRANKALKMKRQILLAIFDQKIHSGPQVDTVALFAKLQDEIQGIPTTPGTNFPASFGHMANSYDAQYYGYLWSEVFAMDMFQSRFKKEGPMNPVTGLAYRELILARGGSVDASEMLKEFLGREPNQNAFLQNNGLEVEP
jgi:thimet oligopeptidase